MDFFKAYRSLGFADRFITIIDVTEIDKPRAAAIISAPD